MVFRQVCNIQQYMPWTCIFKDSCIAAVENTYLSKLNTGLKHSRTWTLSGTNDEAFHTGNKTYYTGSKSDQQCDPEFT